MKNSCHKTKKGGKITITAVTQGGQSNHKLNEHMS